MKNPKTWYLRAYQENDEQEIVAFYNATFRRDRTLTHWNWKFKQNPYSKQVLASLAYEKTTDTIVGHNTVIPVRLNFMGNPIRSGQFSDILVHPDYRKQKIFITNAENCFTLCVKEKIDAVYVFPNRKSYPGFMRYLNGKRIAYFRRYFKRLKFSTGNRLWKKPVVSLVNMFYITYLSASLFIEKTLLFKLKNLSRQLTFHVSNRLPTGYDKLWNDIKSYEVLSVWKDTEYLEWRYENNPDNQFEYIYLEEEGKILALAVVYIRSKKAVICEFFVKRKNLWLGRLFLIEIQQLYMKRKTQYVSFTGHDNGFFDQVFKYFDDHTLFRYVLCGRVFDAKDKLNDYFPYPFNWSFTYGDIDTL
ncbi:MAG: GNAT family N-acetyltransferase [Bacteroidales bacterium]|nr:GNAT family N-acetyltransferase [Bacteroidales bacterium]